MADNNPHGLPDVPPEVEAMAAEITALRNTLAALVQLVKKQAEKSEAQDAAISELASQTAQLESRYHAREVEEEEEAVVLARLNQSSKLTRAIRATPDILAYAAHLYFVKQYPQQPIIDSGLLTVSKMHGLTRWPTQHLLDYCRANKVMDIYRHGLTDTQVRELIGDEGLNVLQEFARNHQA